MCDTVSIIVTTKNRPILADRAIQSALVQSHGKLEVLVVDDGSDEPFTSSRSDERLRIIRHEDSLGLCAARNAGLKEAKGYWIAFLDDDDMLHPKMIEHSLEAANRSTLPHPIGVLSAMQWTDGEGNDIPKLDLPMTLKQGECFLEVNAPGRCVTFNSLLAPTSVVREIGGFDDSIIAHEFSDFFLRLGKVCSLQGTDEVGYIYTQHDGARLTTSYRKMAIGLERTALKHLGALTPKNAGNFLRSSGYNYLKAGSWWDAIRLTSLAVRRNPRRGRNWFFYGAALLGPYTFSAIRSLARRR